MIAMRNDIQAVSSERIYFPKRAGMRWEIWWRYTDGHTDPTSGEHEWNAAAGVRLWRWWTAVLIAQAMRTAYRDGWWERECPL